MLTRISKFISKVWEAIESKKGSENGIATLDGDDNVPSNQLGRR